METNGESQIAHFSFEAFRFVEHKDKAVSTFYLHCITRLCEVDNCRNQLPVSSMVTIRRTEKSNITIRQTGRSTDVRHTDLQIDGQIRQTTDRQTYMHTHSP